MIETLEHSLDILLLISLHLLLSAFSLGIFLAIVTFFYLCVRDTIEFFRGDEQDD